MNVLVQNREQFVVPVVVPWPKVADALSYYFLAHTGCGLTYLNLDYLGRKLLGVGMEEDITQMSVTRQQMCRDQLRTRTFTFWECFYKHLDLIKTTLKHELVEELILKFTDKKVELLHHEWLVGEERRTGGNRGSDGLYSVITCSDTTKTILTKSQLVSFAEVIHVLDVLQDLEEAQWTFLSIHLLPDWSLTDGTISSMLLPMLKGLSAWITKLDDIVSAHTEVACFEHASPCAETRNSFTMNEEWGASCQAFSSRKTSVILYVHSKPKKIRRSLL